MDPLSSDVLLPPMIPVLPETVSSWYGAPQVKKRGTTFTKPIDKAAKALRARRFTIKDKTARSKLTRNLKLITREVFEDPSDTIKDLSTPIKHMLLKTIKDFYAKDKQTHHATADVMERCVDAGVRVSTDNVVTFLYGTIDESGDMNTEMRVQIQPERDGFRITDVNFVNKVYGKMTAFTRANPCAQLNMAAFQAERHAKHLAVDMLEEFFPVKTDSMILSECVGESNTTDDF